VTYTGSQNLSDLTAANGWSETLQGPLGDPCGSNFVQPGGPGAAALIPVDQHCIDLYGALPAPWTVTVTYHNRVGDPSAQPLTYHLDGPPPGYNPCAVNGFSGAWGTTLADGISVSVDPSSQLGGCTNWSYTLVDTSTTPTTPVCQVATDLAAGQAPPLTIDLSTCATPPTDTWALQGTFTKPDGSQAQTTLVPLGAPPPS
jgi:hypothetical protein